LAAFRAGRSSGFAEGACGDEVFDRAEDVALLIAGELADSVENLPGFADRAGGAFGGRGFAAEE
jgi:hypothetical protein